MSDEKSEATPREMQDERCKQIVALSTDIDVTLQAQQEQIAEQAEQIADLEAEVARLQAIIDEGGGSVEPGPSPDVRPPDIWVLPVATGDGSGSSPENCAAYGALNTLVGEAGPGKVIGLLGDRGVWEKPAAITLSKGGAKDAHVLIRGTNISGGNQAVQIKSGREKPLPYLDPTQYTGGSGDTLSMPRSEWAQGTRAGGATLFTFKKGADWLKFAFINGDDISAFGFYDANLMEHIYEDIKINNAKHGWHMTDDPVAGETVEKAISNMLWRRIDVDFFEEDVFRWRGTSHHLVCDGFSLDSRRVMGHITFGFNIGTGDTARNDKVTDWVIKNGTIKNCHDTHYEKPWYTGKDAAGKPTGESYAPTPGKIRNPALWKGDVPGTDYWNGDGISAERGCDNGLIEDVTISGCTDAACDIKAGNVTFRRVHAFDNKRNFRLYSPGLLMEDCISENAKKRGGSGGTAHIMLKGGDASGKKGCELTLSKCKFSGAPGNAFGMEAEFKYGIKVEGEETCTGNGVTLNAPPYVP